MSERTHAPQSGGRVKDQRGTVPARDASTRQGSDARGARHFDSADEGRADTRRSGIRGSAGEPPRARSRNDADDVRGERRSGSEPARGKGRRPEPTIGKSRAEAGASRRRRRRIAIWSRTSTTVTTASRPR